MDIFDNLIGNFNGYALENLQEGNPNPALDTTDFSTFFSDDFNENLNPEEVQVTRRNFRRLKKRLRRSSKAVTFRQSKKQNTAFGGF